VTGGATARKIVDLPLQGRGAAGNCHILLKAERPETLLRRDRQDGCCSPGKQKLDTAKSTERDVYSAQELARNFIDVMLGPDSNGSLGSLGRASMQVT